MADSAQDKKLPATERRIRKARTEGQVARSRDLGHFVLPAAAVSMLAYTAQESVRSVAAMLGAGLHFNAQALRDPAAMLLVLSTLGAKAMWLLAPLLALLWVLAATSSVLAGGWNFSLQPLQPKFSKLNPLTGLTRLLSLQQLGDTLKACLLALLLGLAAALVLHSRWAEFAHLLALPLQQAMPQAGQLIISGLWPLAALLALFALVDVPLQRYKLMQRLRMSHQEVKQEMKEAEGNAQMKGQMRARMREMSNRRMMAAVPTADLVVMNPTHFAVALKYEEGQMAAPRVVAKGADLVALRIRDIARESGVPVLQAPALARALYAHTPLEREVPARLFAAVAQVLAWVYQLRQARTIGRVAEPPAPTPEVPPDLDPAHPLASPASRRGAAMGPHEVPEATQLNDQQNGQRQEPET